MNIINQKILLFRIGIITKIKEEINKKLVVNKDNELIKDNGLL